LTFASWDQLPEDAKEMLKTNSLKKLLQEEIAGIIAGIGDLFE
jgi:phage shock protein PspC (stress-responsive transcriptional regulator)